MKAIQLISVLLFWSQAQSQNPNIIKLAFQDKSNFDITKKLDSKRPGKYYVLNRTDKWETCRFFIKDNIKSDSVRKAIANDEHHHYNDCYIFKDPALDRLFSDVEKEHLYQFAQLIKSRTLANGSNNFALIKSFRAAKQGFFFTVSDPVFSTDNQFAFLEIISHKKTKETKEFNDTYFGRTFLIYQNVKGKAWTRIKKIDFLIL